MILRLFLGVIKEVPKAIGKNNNKTKVDIASDIIFERIKNKRTYW